MITVSVQGAILANKSNMLSLYPLYLEYAILQSDITFSYPGAIGLSPNRIGCSNNQLWELFSFKQVFNLIQKSKNVFKTCLQGQIIRVLPFIVKLLVHPQDAGSLSNGTITANVAGKNREPESPVITDVSVDGCHVQQVDADRSVFEYASAVKNVIKISVLFFNSDWLKQKYQRSGADFFD